MLRYLFEEFIVNITSTSNCTFLTSVLGLHHVNIHMCSLTIIIIIPPLSKYSGDTQCTFS